MRKYIFQVKKLVKSGIALHFFQISNIWDNRTQDSSVSFCIQFFIVLVEIHEKNLTSHRCVVENRNVSFHIQIIDTIPKLNKWQLLKGYL